MVKRILLIGFGLVLLIAGEWFFFFRSSSVSAAKERDASQVLYLYCPECGFEITCGPGQEKVVVPCPRCGQKKGTVLEVSKYSHARGGIGYNSSNPVVPALALGITVLLGVVVFFLTRGSSSSSKEVFHYHQCAKCRRRLRYPRSQVGKKGVCPRCKLRFVCPEPAKSIYQIS